MDTMTTDPTTTVGSLRLTEGLVGFPAATAYEVRAVADGLVDLVPTDDDGPSFVAADAGAWFPAYHPEIDDQTADRLGLTDAADALVLLIVTVAADLAASTVNLLAPVVVNIRTGVAEQVVLTGTEFPVRARLLDAA